MMNRNERGIDFIIIGAMKCATSTLHDQLSAHASFSMSVPKEPNFFSDDEVFSRGLKWYESLFADASPHAVRGESSTQYSKLPHYPDTVERLHRTFPNVRIIYSMRHPVDRLVSHYIHEWTQRTISCGIDSAVWRHPELVDYGLYNMQIEPYLRAFGPSSVLPVFVERMILDPNEELQRIFRFLDVADRPNWNSALRSNASANRLRVSPLRDAIMSNRVVTLLRRALVPKTVRTMIRGLWTMKDRPKLGEDAARYVEQVFDRDLVMLGDSLGVHLSCANWTRVVQSPERLEWV